MGKCVRGSQARARLIICVSVYICISQITEMYHRTAANDGMGVTCSNSRHCAWVRGEVVARGGEAAGEEGAATGKAREVDGAIEVAAEVATSEAAEGG